MAGCLRVLLLSLCLLAPLAVANEEIEDFAVTLQVQGDGSLLVTELITVQAEGEQIRRGIYRDLPVRYQLALGLLEEKPISLLGVTRDGVPEQVRREQQGAWVRYYLGSPDHVLEPGRYQYQLRYRSERQLLHHQTTDELYWNVTGNGWVFPIQHASVTVQLPAGAQIGQLAAYTGQEGEQGKGYRIIEQGADHLTLETTRPLAPYTGLTLALDWPAGLVPRPGPAQRIFNLLWDNPGISLGGLLVAGLLIYYLRTWRRLGRDPRKGLIIPLFAAPQGMTPAQAGYLWHRGFTGTFSDARAFAVWLTEMAIRKYLQIEDDKGSGGFLLTCGEAKEQDFGGADRNLRKELFPPGTEGSALKLASRYEPRLAEAVVSLSVQLEEAGQSWFSNNRKAWGVGLAVAVVASLLMVAVGLHGEEAWGTGIGGLVFSIGLGIPSLIVFSMARRAASFGKQVALVLSGLMFVWPVPVGLWMLATVVALPVIGLLGLCWLLVALFYFWLPAPSPEGRRLLDALEGYRNYLQLAEGDTLLQAGGAPAMSIALYEAHLPYAMALGVEEQWSARFSAALASGLVYPPQRDYQPSWYHSHSHFSSPLAMSSALSSGLGSFTASAASAPASPSSGGGGSSGGSSGGGSSGGGGGGGGGGGW
ncbi:MAG TPA: DUF2207 domain-containing protein [Pseudomonas sp.]|nr:DUF2207 domain-containing protein [Pseudomonas sp.]